MGGREMLLPPCSTGSTIIHRLSSSSYLTHVTPRPIDGQSIGSVPLILQCLYFFFSF